MAIIDTEEQLIEKLDKEGINREWYSFDGNTDKIVSFDGEYVYYHSLRRKIEDDEHYYFMFYELSKYARNYEFYNSDKKIQVTSITILTDDGATFETCIKPGIYRLTTSYYGSKKEKLKGYIFDRYDQYGCYSCYHRDVDASIFKEMVIRFEKKTTMEEMQKYGLKYSLHGSSLRYFIPEELRELIINYIDNNNSIFIKSRAIISKILEYFTEEKLQKDEIERLDEAQRILNEALQNEVHRQKKLGIKDNEGLLEVYRKKSNSIEVEYFGRGCSEDRFFRVEHKCIIDAEKLLEN